MEFVNEKHKRLFEQMRRLQRASIMDDPDYLADKAERKVDFDTCYHLWGTYKHPTSRPLLSAEQRAEFEGKYERCARVEALFPEADSRLKERLAQVDALKAAIQEIVESEVDRDSPIEGKGEVSNSG
jgi:hypothetical protein